MERFTEYRNGVPVILDKGEGRRLAAANRFAELEDLATPKKPEIVNGGTAVCPECGDKVLRCYSFCRGCGQRIDWGKKKQFIPRGDRT